MKKIWRRVWLVVTTLFLVLILTPLRTITWSSPPLTTDGGGMALGLPFAYVSCNYFGGRCEVSFLMFALNFIVIFSAIGLGGMLWRDIKSAKQEKRGAEKQQNDE